MITRNTNYSIQRLRGLSTDTKPVNVPNGSEFREMDTGKKFLFSAAGTEWIEQPSSGGSGGGGSVEPLIVEIGTVDGQEGTFMKAQAKSIYDAYSAGIPVVLVEPFGLGVAVNILNQAIITNNASYYTFSFISFEEPQFRDVTYFSMAPTDFPKRKEDTNA